MAFDNLLEDVCNDATVFFAMIQMGFEIFTLLIFKKIFELFNKLKLLIII